MAKFVKFTDALISQKDPADQRIYINPEFGQITSLGEL
jgi:hypothetical protein